MQLKDYGEARQITLFEHGQVALQILTSDMDACPAEILSWLKSRWREENFLKYASRELRDRQDLRLPRQHRDEHQDRRTTRPARPGERRRPRRGEGARRRRARTWPCMLADPGHHRRRQEHPADPRRAGEDHPRRARHWPPPPRPASRPRETARQRHRPRRESGAAARRPPRPADGAAAARPQRRALAIERTSTPTCSDDDEYRAITRADHHPRPGKHHHLHPRRDHRHSSTSPAHPASPAPWRCSWTRSTPPAQPCPATPGPSPTS